MNTVPERDDRAEIIRALSALNYEFEDYLSKYSDDLLMKVVARTGEEVVIRISAYDERSFAVLTNTAFRVGYRLTGRMHFSPDYAWTYYIVFSRRSWDDLSEVEEP